MRAVGSLLGTLLLLSTTIVPCEESVADTLTVIRTGSGAGTVISDVGTIDCGATCSASYASGTLITLTATPAAGSQFIGWLGRCSGKGSCQFMISGNTMLSSTFAPAALGEPALDIDGTRSYDALTDGLLVIRYLFGLSGPALVSGAVGPNATRMTAGQVAAYLDDVRPLLDIDGNGVADALTDGLLIIRYLFGLRGPTLINNSVGFGATRTVAGDIEAWIATSLPVIVPPDPSEVAPTLDTSVATAMFAATTFLYSGANAIQSGVAPGTIVPSRIAVLRGALRTPGGAALPGVTISILDHPEFGHTLSRADGGFDLAVNGGGVMTVSYRKDGLLPVHRHLAVPWRTSPPYPTL